MGLDIWLPSVFDYGDGPAVSKLLDDVDHKLCANGKEPSFEERSAAYFDAMRATGGYYREAYNSFGLSLILGWDWRKVFAPLENRGVLPVDQAKNLLAAIEHHYSVTPEAVGLACDICSNQKDREWILQHLTSRRDGLLALLRRAISRNEPLMVSAI
jgi:hypothetical protein